MNVSTPSQHAPYAQEAKVLLLGDSRAFFTMYKAIVDVGLKPFQLDRNEALLKAGRPAEEVKKAAEEAATAANCLLVTHQQLACPGFPFNRCTGAVLASYCVCSFELKHPASCFIRLGSVGQMPEA